MSNQTKQLRKAVFSKVDDLQPGTEGYNLIVKVGEVRAILKRTRADGSKLHISEALVGDASGCVLLTAKNDQIDLMQTGSTIVIRNCKVEMFKGHMRLAVDKWGLVEKASADQTLKGDINSSNNLSDTEYELVEEPKEPTNTQ